MKMPDGRMEGAAVSSTPAVGTEATSGNKDGLKIAEKSLLRVLAELYSLLTPEQKRRLLRLQFLLVLMALAEIVGVVSIGPFMALVGNPERLQGSGTLADWYRMSGLSSPEEFLILMGVIAFSLLLISSLFSMFTLWRLLLYGAKVGGEISSRLFEYYMHQHWLFHVENASSSLMHGISQECRRVSDHIIGQFLRMNAKIVLALLMVAALFIYNPWIATLGLLIFGLSYIVLYRLVRSRLTSNSSKMSSSQAQRFKLMSEGFGGIKDILLLGRQEAMTRKFREASRSYAYNHGTSLTLSQAPRHAMELIAYGAVIMLVLYLLGMHQGDTGSILQLIAIYALAGFKLLPAFQQVYGSLTTIRANLSAYYTLRDDLYASRNMDREAPRKQSGQTGGKFPEPGKRIQLKGVSFRYPGQEEAVIKELDLTVPANSVIGIVGSSGCGKSTIIDLLLGLISPCQGVVQVDGIALDAGNMRAWQEKLGYVPQSIFLADDTIRHNIALGLPDEQVDLQRLGKAISLANLDGLVDKLPKGLDTVVGERGVQLSGGQRQRIGIARALYQDASVLILDEATSALDGITENVIMREIHAWSGSRTIVLVAHRISTVKQCEWIYLMDHGKVVDQGCYEDLIHRNSSFRAMAGENKTI
ncbi:ABC transporter ATP-binding protein [Halomonas sp. LR5S13]|uniref:ABC transporter ATP-binding protein n=1 Tax=Halomonas rhizosphaerae TaxID=3043296 RepID=UPI0024A7B9A7|nr:ABC transporter ATP-binding protein [Halomonas rhizosphaerae]MDI5920872.1 ABC transporter ATP-binding protein [Halomonas rhizosphaerae]